MVVRHGVSPVMKALEILARQEPGPSRKQSIACPSDEHDDKQPSATRYPDGGFRCHGCGAHGDALDFYALREGLTIPQALNRLGAFDKDWTPPPPKPGPRRVYMPDDVRQVLEASEEFPRRWQVAKLLALHDPTQAKKDILAGWTFLEPLDIPEIWRLTCLIRGVALFRHADPRRAHEPYERSLAVRKLLRELEDA